MKQTQVVVAAVLLAVMVFIITFAMNFLGGSNPPPLAESELDKPRPEFVFPVKSFPPDGLSSLDREDKSTGYQDFWFFSPENQPVKVGLYRRSCKCTSVEVFTLSSNSVPRFFSDALALVGTGNGPVVGLPILQSLAITEMQKDAEMKELLRDVEYIEVPPRGIGWVRLRYKGEKIGKQQISAEMWMGSKEGKTATLDMKLDFFEPLRLKPVVQAGSIREEDLARGFNLNLFCWSSTRESLDLDVKSILTRGNPSSDTLLVGKPVFLNEKERKQLESDINNPSSELMDTQGGPVLCGYRIPVTLLGVAPDKVTPFDIGPFYRRVLVSASNPGVESRSILIQGRVRGNIELGIEDEGGELNLRTFSRRFGKKEVLLIQSSLPEVSLEFDRERTPEFLTATVESSKEIKDRVRNWTLRVEAIPEKASGIFPRKDDPAYEDSAVYLKARIPGKPLRYIRIGVRGTATEG